MNVEKNDIKKIVHLYRKAIINDIQSQIEENMQNLFWNMRLTYRKEKASTVVASALNIWGGALKIESLTSHNKGYEQCSYLAQHIAKPL